MGHVQTKIIKFINNSEEEFNINNIRIERHSIKLKCKEIYGVEWINFKGERFTILMFYLSKNGFIQILQQDFNFSIFSDNDSIVFN